MRYLFFFLLFIIIVIETLGAREFDFYPDDAPMKIKKICKIARGGDSIIFHEGNYTKKFPLMKCSGDKKAPLLIRAKKKENVTIRTPWRIKGRYLTIEDLNFRGFSDRLDYEHVIKQWWKPSKELRQIGIAISGHHILLRNNTIGYFTASGIKCTRRCDYLTIDHNIIYNNAWWSTGGTGGLVIKNINQIDNSKAAKVKIINNLFFGNESRIFSHVFKKGFSKLVIDEGESFLLQQKDDASKKGAKKGHYEGRYLVKNNLILYNGKGSSLNKVDRVDFLHNYLYCNGTTAKSKNAGGIRGKNTNYDNFIHNYVSSCKDRAAISVLGRHNLFKENIVKSSTQKRMAGVKIVKRVFQDPKNLRFAPQANRLLASFAPLLRRYGIKIRPTGYVVDRARQIEDIIHLIPTKGNTIIKRYEDKIVIYNIDNRGIKGLGKNFVLKLK